MLPDTQQPPNYLATVVVCVRKDRRVLRLLESLTRQSLDRRRLQVVAVCSGEDVYGSALEQFDLNLVVVKTADIRLPVARNIGLSHVQAPYYLTTDADCVAEPDWVARMVGRLEMAGEQFVAVGGRIKKYAEKTMVQKYGITVDDGQRSLNYLPALNLPYVTGANSGFRTDRVRAVGGYDESFFCGEDVDLCYRLGLAGGQLTVEPAATVYHEDRERLIDHYRRFRYYAIDQALLFKKYRQWSGRRWLVDDYPIRRLRDAGGTLLSGLSSIARGQWEAPQKALVTAVEAFGVLAGDLRGSWRHRVLYL